MGDIREISHEGKTLVYILERKRVKNLNLRVRPDKSIQVYVSAPERVPLKEIEQFLLSRWNTIWRWLERTEQPAEEKNSALQYQTGEILYFLGSIHILKVVQGLEEAVTVQGNLLCLTVKQPEDISRKEKIFHSFWRGECEKLFLRLAQELHPLFIPYGVDFPQLRLRSMRSRWGSCFSHRGIITLNTELLKYPLGCIRYVVLHEFCHFVHPNHSSAFYALLEQFMPDWKLYRELLKKTL